MANRGYYSDRELRDRSERDRDFIGYGNQSAGFVPGRGEAETYGRGESDLTRFGRYGAAQGAGPQRSHLRCREIMTRNVTTCRRDTPVREVARMMRDEDLGAVPVIGNDGRLEGIVTDRDLVVRGLTADKAEPQLRAEDCMTDDVYTVNSNERVVDVIREMGDHQVRRLPVVDGRHRLVGIIAMADVALQTNKDLELQEALEDISKPSSWFGRLSQLFS